MTKKENMRYIRDDEILLENCEDLFKNNIYTNDEFLKILSKIPYYLIFGKFMLNYDKDIHNSKEFINSSCEIFIEIIDSIYVDIYFKDESLLETLEKQAKVKKFKIIKRVYDKFFQEYIADKTEEI